MPSKMTLDLSSEIWAVADLMRDAIPASDYNKVILPLAVLRRLECALEPTRDEVVEYVEANKERLGTFNEFYCTKSKRPFYNVTPFRLADLGSAQTYKNLKKYVDGFSPNVRAGRDEEWNGACSEPRCTPCSETDHGP